MGIKILRLGKNFCKRTHVQFNKNKEVHKLINRLNPHSHRFRPVCFYFSLIAKLVFEVLFPNPPLLHLKNPERLLKNKITITLWA